MLIVFVISSLVLGQELLTGEAYTRTGSGKFDLDWTVYCMLSKEEKNKNNW